MPALKRIVAKPKIRIISAAAPDSAPIRTYVVGPDPASIRTYVVVGIYLKKLFLFFNLYKKMAMTFLFTIFFTSLIK
jgi:hypothetical protein